MQLQMQIQIAGCTDADADAAAVCILQFADCWIALAFSWKCSSFFFLFSAKCLQINFAKSKEKRTTNEIPFDKSQT